MATYILDTWQVQRSYRWQLALSKAKKGLWKVFSECDIHYCRLFTHACAFIYRTVPHRELSNVLRTVNFPNAAPRPSSPLAHSACTRTETCNSPPPPFHFPSHLKAALAELLPIEYRGGGVATCCWRGVSDESVCHQEPACPF